MTDLIKKLYAEEFEKLRKMLNEDEDGFLAFSTDTWSSKNGKHHFLRFFKFFSDHYSYLQPNGALDRPGV